MGSLGATRAAGRARDLRQQRLKDRRRDALVLILRHLCDAGYTKSYQALAGECNLSLAVLDVADNMSLEGVMEDFAEAFELKYGRRPKFSRRPAAGTDPDAGLKPAAAKGSRMARGRTGGQDCDIGADWGMDSLADHRGEAISSHGEDSIEACGDGGGESCGIEVRGVGVNGNSRAAKNPGDQRDAWLRERLERPLPGWAWGEWGDLARGLMREVVAEGTGVEWGDVVGLEGPKRALREALVLPQRFPAAFADGLLAPWRAALLYGPPGAGKTMLARAAATECRSTFFNVSASSLVSKWRGDSEKLVRILFALAAHYAPSTIFLDEVDALVGRRGAEGEHEASRRMKTELLVEMDGLRRRARGPRDGVFLLAATNLPWELDAALLRRMEKRIMVPLPDAAERARMFAALLSGRRCEEGVSLDALAAMSEGFSGFDVMLAAKEAAMAAFRRAVASGDGAEGLCGSGDVEVGPIGAGDLEAAVRRTKPSGLVHLDLYRQFSLRYEQPV